MMPSEWYRRKYEINVIVTTTDMSLTIVYVILTSQFCLPTLDGKSKVVGLRYGLD